MPNLVVKPVQTRKEKRQFLELPWQLHRRDPNWIPPLRRNQRELVGYRSHPFYQDAVSQTFLALRDGEPCGRIAAIVYHGHNRCHNEQRGFFGFFDSIDDQEVATGLFDAARQWLEERGMKSIRGPMNPSLHYEVGLLVDGFDSPPRFMMTYNPPYYERLVESYGFRKSQDMYAYWGHSGMLDTGDPKIDRISEAAKQRFNVQLRRFDTKRFKDEVRTFLRIYNEASSAMWGFVPMSDAEIDHVSDSLRYLICPELTAIAEVDGRAVGAVFGLLDYNPRIKQIDGRLFPLGFMRLLWNRRAIKSIRILAAEVVPEYQAWGLGLVLLDRLVPDVRAWGVKDAEFSWVLESNQLSRGSLERGGAKRIKTYRIYDDDLT